MKYVIPVLFVCVFLFAAIKRVNAFSSFTKGAGEAVKFVLNLLPILCATFIMCELFEKSHLSDAFCKLLSPVLNLVGIPPELSKLMLIKPFSGSGSLTYLTDVIQTHGADSYISRCACVMFGSSETVFYISAVYFSACAHKKRLLPILIILLATFISSIFACLLCRVI